MPKFRKKPVVIEAEQFRAKDKDLPFQGEGVIQFWDGKWFISTLEGKLFVSEGDWIIKGVEGEFYPCKPDIFKKTYEAVE